MTILVYRYLSILKESGTIELKESGTIEVKESGTIELKESGTIELKESGTIELKENGTIEQMAAAFNAVTFQDFWICHACRRIS